MDNNDSFVRKIEGKTAVVARTYKLSDFVKDFLTGGVIKYYIIAELKTMGCN